MARDLDFSPRRRKVDNTPVVAQATVSNRRPSEPTDEALIVKKSISGWVWFLIVVIVFGVSIWLGYLYYQRQSGAQISPTTSLSALNIGLNPITEDNVFNQTQSVSVQVYDSGAGTVAVGDIVTKLKGLGYQTENVNESQFKYDKTYIWYREGLLTEAKKIESVLSDRIVGLKETKIAGSFDILVLVGEK